jgi:hypothetical protein
MPKPRKRLRNVNVKEVSLVGAGDNPPARVVLFKARGAPAPDRAAAARFNARVAELAKKLGAPPSAAALKELYDEVRERQQASDVYDALRQRMSALSDSLQSIIWFYPLSTADGEPAPAPDRAALIRETVRQFADSIDRDTEDLLAGRLAKLAERWPDASPTRADLETAVREVLESLPESPADPATPAGSARTEESDVKKTLEQILAGLGSDEEREVVKAAIAAAATAADPEAVKKAATEAALAALPEAVRKQLEADRAEQAALRKEMADLRKEREREAFAKTIKIENLPAKSEELAELLFEPGASWPEQRAKIVAVLKAADAAMGRFGVFDPLGSERGGAGEGSAAARVEQLAGELRKTEPTLSLEKARTRVRRENPQLYAEEQAELDAGLA